MLTRNGELFVDPHVYREITQRLNAALGGMLVAARAGSKDAKVSHEWAKRAAPNRTLRRRRVWRSPMNNGGTSPRSKESTLRVRGSSAPIPGLTMTPSECDPAKTA